MFLLFLSLYLLKKAGVWDLGSQWKDCLRSQVARAPLADLGALKLFIAQASLQANYIVISRAGLPSPTRLQFPGDCNARPLLRPTDH